MLISKQILLWKCDQCGVTEGPGEIEIPPLGEFVRPQLPSGWVQIESLTYCPRHIMDIYLDGKHKHHLLNWKE